MRIAVSLFSCVSKARKSLRAFNLQKGATKEIPPYWRMGIAGGAYVSIERITYKVQQIMKRLQSDWILSLFYEKALFQAPILCRMSNEKYLAYSMKLFVLILLVKLIKNYVLNVQYYELINKSKISNSTNS